MASYLEVTVSGGSATSVRLGSTKVSYGILRRSTRESVIDAGTELSDQGSNVWRLDDWHPEEGITYDYAYTVTWADTSTTEYEGSVVGGVTVPTSDYIGYAEFVTRWGEKNVISAANIDNAKAVTIPSGRVQLAFDYATDEISDVLRGGVYAVPLDFTSNGGTVPFSVRECVHIIAYEFLYRTRGWDEKNKVGNKISKDLMNTYFVLAYIRAGHRQIQAAINSGSNLAMSAVNSDNICYGYSIECPGRKSVLMFC